MSLRALGSVFSRGSSSTSTSQAILEKALRSAAGKRSHHPLLISWPPSYLGGAGAANTLGESDVFVHKYVHFSFVSWRPEPRPTRCRELVIM